MADETYHFQWQNPVLLETIYPLRKMKLRDFLVYYQEIDLWPKFRDMSDAELRIEKEKFIKARHAAMEREQQEFEDLLLTLRVPRQTRGGAPREPKAVKGLQAEQATRGGEPREPRETRGLAPEEPTRAGGSHQPRETRGWPAAVAEQHTKFDNLCNQFAEWLGTYKDIHKEKIFIDQRVAEWEEHRRELNARLIKKQIQAPAEKSLDPLAVADQKLDELYKLQSICSQLHKRRQALAPARAKDEKNKRLNESIILPLKTAIAQVDADIAEIRDTLDWLAKLPEPPDPSDAVTAEKYFAAAQEHFTLKGISTELAGIFQGKEPDLLRKFTLTLTGLQQNLPKGRDSKLVNVNNQMRSLRMLRDDVDRRIASASLKSSPQEMTTDSTLVLLGEIRRKVVDELNALRNLQLRLEYSVRGREQRQKDLENSKKTLATLETRRAGLIRQLAKPQEELDQIEKRLAESGNESLLTFNYMDHFKPEQVTALDIFNAEIDAYRKKLDAKSEAELLEEIVVGRFLAAPERYKPWLQYMVIHFSGMRYASAHGSWADPKDLLINLEKFRLQDEFKKPDAILLELRQQKVISYSSLPAVTPGAPLLAKTTDREAQKEIESHMTGIRTHQWQRPLLALCIDEMNCEVEAMSPQQVLDRLKVLKDLLPIPRWMWKEIVRMTDLRLTEVGEDDTDWEKATELTPAERSDRNLGRYWELINEWKQGNLTNWRDEHDRTGNLVVTRAVCNEVAEHIQHLRGHKGAAGLTSKPDWYRREETEFFRRELPAKLEPGSYPYFVRARDPANYEHDFQVGASILWLRFVHDSPNEWRVAKPLVTRNGDPLIPVSYTRGGRWNYTMGVPTKRTRSQTGEGKKGTQVEYLRWMHEATVAEVAEVANEKVVLTFETNLPTDDRRRSTIGVFKRYVDDLTHDLGEDAFNPAFVGYVLEGISPEDMQGYAEGDDDGFTRRREQVLRNLENMLDWNKILRRQVMTPEKLEEYRNAYIRAADAFAMLPEEPAKKGSMMAGLRSVPCAEDVPVRQINNRPVFQMWRVKWDWEVDPYRNARPAVRLDAPDPCVFRCGEINANKNGHYVDLNEAWQFFWFDLCSKVVFGVYHKELKDFAPGKYKWLAKKWEMVAGTKTAFTNFKGVDILQNFVLGERLKKEPPGMYTLVCGGAIVTGTVAKNAGGIEMLNVDHFDWAKGPPDVRTINPYDDPRIFFANIITRKLVKDGNGQDDGYRVSPFPQFGALDVPVPLIAKTDIYYPLANLQEIRPEDNTPGIKKKLAYHHWAKPAKNI